MVAATSNYPRAIARVSLHLDLVTINMGMWMFTGHHIVHQMQGEAKSEI